MNAQPALHPADETLQAYGLGKLDDASAESVGAHVEACPSCRRRVAEISSDRSHGRLRDASPLADSPAPVGSMLADLSTLDRGAGAPPAPPSASPLPRGLAESTDYEVISELGRGGMGIVFLARNRLMGRLEVLKVVGGHHLERREVLERFLREIRSAARLRHPNIVAAYSALRLGESLVLAMEYAEGLDLARMVKARGPLPVGEACSYVQQAAMGLQHAHEHGMVHRDIKPANLILAHEGDEAVIKVLDFGLAKVTSEDQVDTSLTREGQMLGTPDYIAPEQIRDAQSADIRADIYSLGCTFYFLLTGGPPFGGDKLWDLYQAHLSTEAGPLNLVRPEVTVELDALVARMMAKEPDRRFQTPGAVAQALVPFVKKANPGPMGSAPGISRAGPPAAQPGRPVAVRGPARPAVATPPTPPPLPRSPAPPAPARPAVGMPPGPPPLRKNPPSPPPRPATAMDGRIDVPETRAPRDGSSETLRTPVARPPGRPDLPVWSTAIRMLRRFGPRAWWTIVALAALGLVIVGAAVRPTSPPGPTKDQASAQPGPTKDEGITNTLGMEFTLIPAGEFPMGSPEDDREASVLEKPRHVVRIIRPFYLGVTEVTRGQFRRFVDETGYRTEAETDGKGGRRWNDETGKLEQDPRCTWQNPGFDQKNDHPVVNVSWKDAVTFAGWLSRTERKSYRLPTEAEWEYACRARTSTRYSFGDDPEGLAAVGNIADGTARERYPDWPTIVARDDYVYTAPVRRFRPNGFGLYDMHGNVSEWCSDEHNDNAYYDSPPAADSPGSSEALARVVRGGSWFDQPRHARSAAFVRLPPEYRSFHMGFRLALDPPGR